MFLNLFIFGEMDVTHSLSHGSELLLYVTTLLSPDTNVTIFEICLKIDYTEIKIH